MDNLENLKQQWKQTSLRVDTLERRNRRTTLDSLAADYRRIFCIGAVAIAPGAYALRECGASVAAMVLYVAIMAIAIAVDATLWRRTRAIDPSAMSVNEVAARAASNRRFHLGAQLVMAPLAIVFLIVLLNSVDEFARAGAIAGAVVGALAGVGIWRRIMRNYRELIRAGRDSFADLDETK